MKKNKSEKSVITIGSGMAYMAFNNAAVITMSDNRDMFSNPDSAPLKKTINNKEYEIVPWGADNDTPDLVIGKVAKCVDMSTNLLFNISVGYGSGIVPVRRKIKESPSLDLQVTYEPVLDNKEINEFLENNNMERYWMEQLTDMNFFFNCFPEIILNQDSPESRKVVELRSKEASKSRWGKMNDNGIIEKHFYSSYWSEQNLYQTQKNPDNPLCIDITDVLDFYNPILDLKRKIGREKYPNLKTKDDKVYRYIVPVNFPTPGKTYYQKAYWYSLFESGWYDHAIMIPEAKNALMKNKMVLQFIVYIHEKYFDWIFQKEGITTDAAKKTRIKKEYDDIQNFLAGSKNQGKAIIAKMMYSPDGKTEMPAIKIVPIDNPLKGGEYIDDSEEVSNIIAYGMNVHSSVIGSHGKGGTINGTEARELFIIKQALMRPFRDLLLKPLYLVKAINKWPEDIYFIIPNLQLTTLDKGTGAVKNTGGPTT